MNNKTYLMICGPGECGKDTVAALLKERIPNIGYNNPTSYYCIDPFYKEVQKGMWTTAKLLEQGRKFEGYEPDEFKTKEEFYQSRRIKRDIWGYWVKVYNGRYNGLKLYEDAMDHGERVFVGLRKVVEFQMFRARYKSLAIWIDRPVPNDPTQEYGPELCDIIIENKKSVDDLKNKIDTMVSFFRQVLNPIGEYNGG